jgi:hypothetical protein
MILGCQASIIKQDQVDVWRPAMFRTAKLIALLGCVAAVGACEEVPPGGPTVMALPSAGKNLTTFEQEDGQCRAQAAQLAEIVAVAQRLVAEVEGERPSYGFV